LVPSYRVASRDLYNVLIIYLADTGAPLFSNHTTGFGPALLKITIT
jgi:hypothetical protein